MVLNLALTRALEDRVIAFDNNALDVFFGFPIQVMLRTLMFNSEPDPTSAASAYRNKVAPFLWTCGKDE